MGGGCVCFGNKQRHLPDSHLSLDRRGGEDSISCKDITEKVTTHKLRALVSSWPYSCHIALKDMLSGQRLEFIWCVQEELSQGPYTFSSSVATFGPVVAVQHICGRYPWSSLLPTSNPSQSGVHCTIALRRITWFIADILLVGTSVQCRDHLPAVPADVI